MRKVIIVIMLNVFFVCTSSSFSFSQLPQTSEEDMFLNDTNVTETRSGSSLITLELKGVDILDVLKVLSKKSGLNIVAGKNVRGQVTLFLQDVEVWDALKIVLETSDLAYEEKGDIIKVITKSDYEMIYGESYGDKRKVELIELRHAKAPAVSEILNHLKSNIGKVVVVEATNSIVVIDTPVALETIRKSVKTIDVPMLTRIFDVKYANVEDLETKLSELITTNVGSIKADARTNKIMVTDITSKIEQIATLIKAFDTKPRQVLIEAKIIEVVLEDEYALGIDWDLVFTRSKVKPVSYTSNALGGVNIPNSSGPLSGVNSSDLAIFTINGSTDEFYAVISALEGMGKANTLSNPRVAVLNNEEASIAVATRQPFVSQTVVQSDSTSTTADNVEFIDVGVTLSVTPTITDDAYIVMAVKPEVSTAGTPLTLEGTDDNGETYTRTVVPIVTSQEVETTVIVRSGTTIVLGGLIQDSQSITMNKVPLLGDIPFLGAAFRSKSDDFKKTELVIFITPRVISPDEISEELDLYFDQNGKGKAFNEMGGAPLEYNAAAQKSQPYFRIQEEPFWQKKSRSASQ
ncbi:MAG: hypothetical protein KKH94_07955 [Candidatus Omnitrophica bacterium]|nr:hypothetical protein [Candidatus Omnitrophota bacterium]